MTKRARRILRHAGGLALAVLVIVAIVAEIQSRRFRQIYETEKVELLRRARGVTVARRGTIAEAALPAPLRRYLEATRGWTRFDWKGVVLKQRGALRAAPDKPFMPFEAEQAYSIDPPGFVWFAKAQAMPFIHVLAKDRFTDAHGNMRISLQGLLTIADAYGAELDQGAGLRYWGEIMAFPEAVSDPHVQWESKDANTARLKVQQGALGLAADFEFDAQGLPAAMHAMRYREVDGKSVLTAWTGKFRDYRSFDGRLFPTQWESIWHLPAGDFLAVTIEILAIETQ